jgi:hypothetical protein
VDKGTIIARPQRVKSISATVVTETFVQTAQTQQTLTGHGEALFLTEQQYIIASGTASLH